MSLPTVLPAADRAVLRTRAAAHTTTRRDALRAEIVLACAEHGVRTSARVLGVARSTAAKWWNRYRATGLEGLRDADRSGRPRRHHDSRRRDVITVATAAPPRPYNRWSPHRIALFLSTSAERLQALFDLPPGHPLRDLHADLTDLHPAHPAHPVNEPVSASWVRSVLTDAHIKVHRVRGWLHRKVDPRFAQRVAAIEAAVNQAQAGGRTLVSLDEKTAVPVRPPIHPDTRGPDGVRRREFEYRRAGTVSWYGIQDVATGVLQMIRAEARMDSAAFTMILDDLVAQHGEDFSIVMDNGSAHTSKHTQRWMAAHPGVVVLFTPVHASWVSPVQVQFAVLTTQVITDGCQRSPGELDRDVQAWTRIRNLNPSPVQWSYQKRSARDLRGPRTSSERH